VEVQDDYSDLPEKMDYYLANEQEALAIIENAHQWVEQFKDKRKERLISLMVADKYFTLSQQQ
ncbi:lipopolysaccharide A protein, partial [Vibrio parahaemolyticus]|nr:lipopolysaccharide A protein [Vibrio parahaemolyticus]